MHEITSCLRCESVNVSHDPKPISEIRKSLFPSFRYFTRQPPPIALIQTAALAERQLYVSTRSRGSHQVGALGRPLDTIMLVVRQIGLTKVELPFEPTP